MSENSLTTAETLRQRKISYKVYNLPMLWTYDLIVVRFGNRFVTRCPSQRILDLYNRCVSANHLDVGVGTGYFLHRCRFPSPEPRVALLDVNLPSLGVTSRRIARYAPEVYHADILDPADLDIQKFDSIACNYLLHCLPGTIQQKGRIFDHLKKLLRPGGVVFGSSILYQGTDISWVSKATMSVYNVVGFFSNRHDDLAGLRNVLSSHFGQVEIAVAGSAALFTAKV